ncbi:hypothetical protein [Streptomyces sp. NPDC045714]|uniref:hypothetical protein n=1 Tax=Streptomyces sp. NPDC045714 TaxID=3154913 RepID=UPI003404AD46
MPPAPAEEPSVADAPATRRPRGRTTLIIAAAALLGIAGGAAAGYGVQAERAPTPLAALSQPGLGYPAKPGSADPAPLTAAQDRRVRTDGDLRKLLVDRPKGAKETLTDELGLDVGWEPIDQYAEMNYKDPHFVFESLAGLGLRRVASVSWEQGKYRDLRHRPHRQEGHPDAGRATTGAAVNDDERNPVTGPTGPTGPTGEAAEAGPTGEAGPAAPTPGRRVRRVALTALPVVLPGARTTTSRTSRRSSSPSRRPAGPSTSGRRTPWRGTPSPSSCTSTPGSGRPAASPSGRR